jgi:hypothetical protein
MTSSRVGQTDFRSSDTTSLINLPSFNPRICSCPGRRITVDEDLSANYLTSLWILDPRHLEQNLRSSNLSGSFLRFFEDV